MNKWGLVLLLLWGVIWPSQVVYAYEVGRVNIILKAEIIAFTCGVDISEANKTVPLGRWSSSQLKNTGDRSQPVPFTFNFMTCPPSSTIRITFSGTTDSTNKELLAIQTGLSAAKNVAIEILTADKKRLPLTQASADIAIDANGNGKVTFLANYIVTKDHPQAGQANADMTFVIDYE